MIGGVGAVAAYKYERERRNSGLRVYSGLTEEWSSLAAQASEGSKGSEGSEGSVVSMFKKNSL